MPAAILRHRSAVALDDMRVAGALMLGGAAVLPMVPGQPGLPCLLRSLTGMPCPLCGMTRSVTATVHGQLAEAVTMNPAGVAIVLLAVALLVFHPGGTVTVPVWAAPVGVALVWAWQLSHFPSP